MTTQAVTTQGLTSGSATTQRPTTTQGSVPDTQAPVITGCPIDIIVSAPPGETSIAVFWEPPTATDDSGVIAASYSNYEPGDMFIRGTTTVNYGFEDEAGNVALCSFEVQVIGGMCLIYLTYVLQLLVQRHMNYDFILKLYLSFNLSY